MLGMGDGDKNRASLVLQIGQSLPGQEQESGESDSGLKAASEQILKAIDERDKDKLTSALKSFYCMCKGMDYEDDEEEEEGYEPDTMF